MEKKKNLVYPLIPLREIVLFPEAILPVLIARPFSLSAARHALSLDSLVVFTTQKDSGVEIPDMDSLHRVGTIGKILQYITPPDGSIRSIVQGIQRVKIKSLQYKDDYYTAEVEEYPIESGESSNLPELTRLLKEYFEEYLQFQRNLSEDLTLSLIEGSSNPLKLAAGLATHLPIKTHEKQDLLESPALENFLEKLIGIMLREIDFLKLKQDIEARVREEIRKSQRQYFLQQEMREIQKELGEEGDNEFAKMEAEIASSSMPEEVREKALYELNKLRKIPPLSPEATVVRNYLDWLIHLPWEKRSKDNLDLKRAQKILDEDHYGLEEAKARILEYLAVIKMKGHIKGQVLCFVGPPGVGKTSLARSIARSLGRKFVRMSLGGVKDEAEIRGHRRTYVGALPGRIIQQIRRAGTKNPVFLLDEVDKIGMDFRGDPQAALMEVLDPDVNRQFQDHYLEVDFDLSEVLFITTANSLHGIPRPLLDRMETIHLRGYLDYEKLQIAKRHLIPRKIKEMGFEKGKIKFDDAAILRIIREYTREAGVRELERQIARIMRKAAREYVTSGKGTRITEKSVEKYLGLPRYRKQEAVKVLPPGVAYGLAWTEYGGEILKVEVAVVKGGGNLELTGSLGDVMKESAKAALSYIRAHYRKFGLPQDFYRDVDIHLHVPQGAIPKDGPSAGVAILAAMLSALTKTPVSGEVGMTGEITLSGEILPVGGLEEKILAAKRSGIKRVLLPRANENEIREMKEELKADIELLFVENLDDFVDKLFAGKTWEKIPYKQEGEYSRWISL